jgi:hypothetical protein
MAGGKGRRTPATSSGGGLSAKERQLKKFGEHMSELVKGTLREELRIDARTSDRIFQEVVDHWDRDVDRLEKEQKNGVDPSKYFGYFGFWIRKLKPITNAFPIERPPDHEIEDVNEQVAICVAIRGIMRAVYENQVSAHHQQEGQRKREAVRRFLRNYLMGPTDERSHSNYSTLVYDMRYRTFGPHHITHMLRWAEMSAIRSGSKPRKKRT